MTPTYLYMQSPMKFERDPDSKIPNEKKKEKREPDMEHYSSFSHVSTLLYECMTTSLSQ